MGEARRMHVHRELLSSVAEQDRGRLNAYSNYDLAVLTPVIFPLSLAVIAVLYAGWTIMRDTRSHPTSRFLAGTITAGECLFAFFCLGSCVANYAEMQYSGGLSACEFQGWYSGFYCFSQPLFIGAAATASLSLQMCKTLPSTSQMAGLVGVSTVFGVIMCSLPTMGETQYRFPKDFCMFDIQDDAIGAVFLCEFLLVSVVMVAACVRLWDTVIWWVYPLLTMVFYWGFSMLFIIVLMDWSGDLDAHSTVWGWMAVLMHTQQLANPLLYSLLWLAQIHRLAEYKTEADHDEEAGQQNDELCKDHVHKYGSGPDMKNIRS